jgi:glycosyltransferase involved in cell wall biosynthesis
LCRKFSWEIIVVDDGSKDKTSAFANTTYATKYGADKCVIRFGGTAGRLGV